MRAKITRDQVIICVLLLIIYFALSTAVCLAADTVIICDTLQYFGDSKKYVAAGSVTIERDGAVIKSDEVTYYEGTSDTVAEGHVSYDDPETSITAARVEMNLDARTGRLFDAEVRYKKYNYRIAGKQIEKRGEAYYYSPDATFTTCDGPRPAWCFKGKDIRAVVDKELTAKDATFRIKGLPILYTPYLWAPIIKERQSGLLIPVVANSRARGFTFTQPFYWAIAENRDATIVLDWYSKRGIGVGLEYRFVEPGGSSGNWWGYHIKDRELEKDYWAIKGLYENRHAMGLGGFLNVDYVNEKDFYQQYSTRRDIRTQRYLESTGEINLQRDESRIFFLSQYWKDLKGDTANVPQKLPEAGYVLNYVPLGGFLFSASLDAADLWRQEGVSAGRVDMYPKILYSTGTDLVLAQMAALRGTGYYLYKQADGDNTRQRVAIEYDGTLHMALYKKYSSFTHIIEPLLRYHFIYSSSNDLPFFDTTELYRKTSNLELSILNRGFFQGNELFAVRLTQLIDTYSGRPFLPLKLDVAFRSPLPLTLAATYDTYTGELDTVTSDMGFHAFKMNFRVGQTYNRANDIMTFTSYVGFSPMRGMQVAGQVWYDATGPGLRDLVIDINYQRQCWGVRLEAVKRPGDFTMKVLFDLSGLTSKSSASQMRIRDYSPTL